VLSGNRNFEARIHPSIKTNFLASPMLVVLFALAGRINIDLFNERWDLPLMGNLVFMKDLWPTETDINKLVELS